MNKPSSFHSISQSRPQSPLTFLLIATKGIGAKKSVFVIGFYDAVSLKNVTSFVINLLNNKTIILLNLAKFRLILADSAYGLVG